MVRRIIRIVLSPQPEWRRIASESGGAGSALFMHALPLAALAASVGFVDPPLSVQTGVEDATASFCRNLLSYWLPVPLLAVVFLGVARLFRARAPWHEALKVSAYAATPLLLAAPLAAVPALAVMPIAGLVHMLYLQYVAAHEVFGVPQSGCAKFVAISSAVAFALFVAISAFTGALGGV